MLAVYKFLHVVFHVVEQLHDLLAVLFIALYGCCEIECIAHHMYVNGKERLVLLRPHEHAFHNLKTGQMKQFLLNNAHIAESQYRIQKPKGCSRFDQEEGQMISESDKGYP